MREASKSVRPHADYLPELQERLEHVERMVRVFEEFESDWAAREETQIARVRTRLKEQRKSDNR